VAADEITELPQEYKDLEARVDALKSYLLRPDEILRSINNGQAMPTIRWLCLSTTDASGTHNISVGVPRRFIGPELIYFQRDAIDAQPAILCARFPNGGRGRRFRRRPGSVVGRAFRDLLVSWTQDTRRAYTLEFAALYACNFKPYEVAEQEMLDNMAGSLLGVPSGVTLETAVIKSYNDLSKKLGLADMDALQNASNTDY
ncbi:hypothetical protein DXG03_006276, partial [Asterophora parasitica]